MRNVAGFILDNLIASTRKTVSMIESHGFD
jgi:hypothetical protein